MLANHAMKQAPPSQIWGPKRERRDRNGGGDRGAWGLGLHESAPVALFWQVAKVPKKACRVASQEYAGVSWYVVSHDNYVRRR